LDQSIPGTQSFGTGRPDAGRRLGRRAARNAGQQDASIGRDQPEAGHHLDQVLHHAGLAQVPRL
jgi:hypothetical protein